MRQHPYEEVLVVVLSVVVALVLEVAVVVE